MIDPSCTAERKCWDHWGSHQRAHVTERGCILATDLVCLCYQAMFITQPTIERLQRLREATDCLISLRGQQWREMTREPFDMTFIPKTPIKKFYTEPKPTLTLDDIIGDL